MADVTTNLLFKVHFIGHPGRKAKSVGACCNSFTICSEINVTTCPDLDTVSLTKHAISKHALQIMFNDLCKIYNIILITTSINGEVEKHELWIHINLHFRHRISREYYRFSV